MACRWTADHLATLDPQRMAFAPVIDRPAPILPDVDLWDYWPVQEEDGRQAHIAGGQLFIFLSAPLQPDPDARHGHARLRLLHRKDGAWRDLGLLFPDDFSPGSREWSGSAVISPAHDRVTLYYTVAGRRGEERLSFSQRLFETEASLHVDGDAIAFSPWSAPREMVVPDGVHYVRDMEGGGGIGTIKAFRDPSFFRDPADGRDYVFFAGSNPRSASPWNGNVGAARREADGRWTLLPPVIEADGVNNELERPHVVVRDGLYYLFWSTQKKVFAADVQAGPNGLYGMVANSLAGPWRPINGSGLVFANPPQAPFQSYSWFVLPDLTVQSFADMVGLIEPPVDAAEARAHFGGMPSPELTLRLEGDRAFVA